MRCRSRRGGRLCLPAGWLDVDNSIGNVREGLLRAPAARGAGEVLALGLLCRRLLGRPLAASARLVLLLVVVLHVSRAVFEQQAVEDFFPCFPGVGDTSAKSASKGMLVPSRLTLAR